ncbi:SLATT domain-containing protein [Vibrio parahaemolyticus]|nr:SLATT domain-containing protein [Vibrio parahaemolyticus]
MEQQSSSSYLWQEINTNIEVLKKKVQSQKSKTRFFNGLSIILGALITLTLGIKASGYEELQKNLALFLGALLTIINGWNAMFDYKKL